MHPSNCNVDCAGSVKGNRVFHVRVQRTANVFPSTTSLSQSTSVVDSGYLRGRGEKKGHQLHMVGTGALLDMKLYWGTDPSFELLILLIYSKIAQNVCNTMHYKNFHCLNQYMYSSGL